MNEKFLVGTIRHSLVPLDTHLIINLLFLFTGSDEYYYILKKIMFKQKNRDE